MTFNLPKQMFQMALLLPKTNNCVILAKTGLNSEVVLNLSDLNSDILLYKLWPEQAKFITILFFDLQV